MLHLLQHSDRHAVPAVDIFKKRSVCICATAPTLAAGIVVPTALQVTLWEMNQQRQPVNVCSQVEEGGVTTHAVWLAHNSHSRQTAAAAAAAAAATPQAVCYALSTPGSATITLKCLDCKGGTSFVQVRTGPT